MIRRSGSDARGQDMFTLSKGHALQQWRRYMRSYWIFWAGTLRIAIACISERPSLGRYSRACICHWANGAGNWRRPGFAIAGRTSPKFDSYCVVGDGELQEGSCWKSRLYAGQHNLDNFCVLVDRNYGQLTFTIAPLPYASAGQGVRCIWVKVHNIDSTTYDGALCGTGRV